VTDIPCSYFDGAKANPTGFTRKTRQDSPEKVKILSQSIQNSSMVIFLVLGAYFYITNTVIHFLSACLSY